MIQAFLPRKLNGPYNARIMNTPTLISDDARQRYLREMGIAVYYPRHPLPGAAASRRYHLQTGAGAQLEAPGTGPVGSEPRVSAVESCVTEDQSAPAGLEGLRESLTNGPSPQPVPAPAPSPRQTPPAAAAEQGEALTFRFSWFRPDERLGVIAGHTGPRLSTQFLQMLQRILAALSPGYRDMALQGEPFHWPLDAAMPGDADTARQVVRAFLRRRCGVTQPPYMLILMDEPPVWLFPPDALDMAATMLEPVTVPGQSQQILRVPALETMARDASVKRPAWEAMQSLIRPLAQCDRE